jgi:hypothetical protein
MATGEFHNKGTLVGRVAPIVRKPISKLSGGRLALGMGDVVAINDPITGQGSNTAAKAATSYLKRILERGNKPFDAPWMQETFDIFWDYAQWVVNWTNSLLIPPAPHVLQLMGAASQFSSLANRIANGFNNPPDYAPWWFDSGHAEEVIRSLAEAAM